MSRPHKNDLQGKIFGRLKVIKHTNIAIETLAKRGNYWLCQCYCGNYTLKMRQSLLAGLAVTCGKCQDAVKYYHEYISYHCMLRRCSDPQHASYKWYGAKGIKVCDRWKQDFLYFLEDMGLQTEADMTIERLDNSKDYEPDNCIWLNKSKQNINKGKYFTLITEKCHC